MCHEEDDDEASTMGIPYYKTNPKFGDFLRSEDAYCATPPNKRPRHENCDPFGKFKGVVMQQNGHWGAQIYSNHQRIWLGTFRSEKEAAMAYDSAAIKLRNGVDSHRNIPWTDHSMKEPSFQNQFSKEDVLKMIRDGSYSSKFDAFLKEESRTEEIGLGSKQRAVNLCDGKCSKIKLFQKELTPSDVGKLNRLVIPKKNATKYFPFIRENDDNDVELVFYDKLMKIWKFRYCYWKSSQSFVFTRGWNRFVKEKKLKENDIISFYSCEEGQNREEKGFSFCLIDVIYSKERETGTETCLADEKICSETKNVGLELRLGNFLRFKLDGKENEKENAFDGMYSSPTCVGEKGFRLFGVQITRFDT